MRNSSPPYRLGLLAIVLLGLLALRPSDALAQLQVGAGLAFSSAYNNLGLQLSASLPVTEDKKLRAAPDLVFYLRENLPGNNKVSWWEVNLNVNYIVVDAEEFGLYALGGINILNRNFDRDILNIDPLFDESQTDIGLNIGGGVDYNIGFGLLYGEFKYVIADFSRLVISAGARLPIGGGGR